MNDATDGDVIPVPSASSRRRDHLGSKVDGRVLSYKISKVQCSPPAADAQPLAASARGGSA